MGALVGAQVAGQIAHVRLVPHLAEVAGVRVGRWPVLTVPMLDQHSPRTMFPQAGRLVVAVTVHDGKVQKGRYGGKLLGGAVVCHARMLEGGFGA